MCVRIRDGVSHRVIELVYFSGGGKRVKARSSNFEPSQEGPANTNRGSPPHIFLFTTASRVFAIREVFAIVVLLVLRHCGLCGCGFHVCRSCYRGQRYCSPACGGQARVLGCRSAQSRYIRTPGGRKTRQAAACRHRRLHARQKTVADQGSTAPPSAAMLPPLPTGSCTFCGKRGAIVAFFPRRGYGGRGVRPVLRP